MQKNGDTSQTDGRVWITWERHRRSRELALAFAARLIELDLPKARLGRYLRGVPATALALWRARGQTVFVQNPSLVLAALASFFRAPLGLTLISDRHSNFKLHTAASRRWRWRIFHWLSRYVTRNSDLTIVTNDALAQLVTDWGGSACVLQDKLPDLGAAQRPDEVHTGRVVCIGTFASDEPIDETVAAAGDLRDLEWYFTGDWRRSARARELRERAPDNVQFTGFLPDTDFVDLLRSADITVVLTTNENCLTCGAYESLALGVPSVLSNTDAIRSYFRAGVVLANPDRDSIRTAVATAVAESGPLRHQIAKFRQALSEDWQSRFATVITHVGDLERRK